MLFNVPCARTHVMNSFENLLSENFVSIEEVKVLLFFFFQKTNTISFVVSLYALAVRKLGMKVNAVSLEERVRNTGQLPGGA